MFSGGNSGYSLADIAAATGGNRNNCNDGWGGSASWIIILFLFVFCGWGNENGGLFGRGNNGGGSYGAQAPMYYADAGLRSQFDTQEIQSGIRNVQNGLCDGFYAMNTGMLNGFGNVTNAITNATHDIESSLNAINIANMQNANALTAQVKDCCCENERLTMLSNYDAAIRANATDTLIATQGCDTRRAIADSARDIIDSLNAGTRAILDYLCQDKITSLTAENQALKFAASQYNQNAFIAAQTNQIIESINPPPRPAFIVPSPWLNPCGYGCNSGCQCG